MSLGREDALDTILQLALNGLAVGCVYGLVALGFVLIYKATDAPRERCPTGESRMFASARTSREERTSAASP
jgi:hypothetical protein